VVDGGKGQLGVALAAARDAGIDIRPGAGLPIIALAKERDFSADATVSDPREPQPAAAEGAASPGEDTPAAATATSAKAEGAAAATATSAKAEGAAAAKPDRIFLAHGKDAIPIGPASAEMFVLAHLRDEAHRFAVTFHRKQRKRRTIRSVLADIPGIGKVRQREILRHFGSLKKVAEASMADLLAVPGMTEACAAAVRDHIAGIRQPEEK
jgi:excinuclease ABC subunit C